MGPRLAVVALSMALGLAAGGQAVPEPRTVEQDVQIWTEAVVEHEPGSFDVHAETIGMWPWSRLNRVLDTRRGRISMPLALRGAMLYLDVAVHVELERRPRYPTEGRVLKGEDGRVLGPGELDSHIWWARKILLLPNVHPSDRFAPDAVTWYRATAAMLARDFSLSNLEPHVRDALQSYPADAGILFDAACLAETFASPQIQAVIPPEMRNRPPLNRLPASGVERTLDQNLMEAEHGFRLAGERDPSFMEARVRLGRVLMLRERLAEARRQLDQAASMTGPPEVRYFAELFRGQALEGRADLPGAAAAYERAAELFPEAQSPRLALSVLRLERGDTNGARVALRAIWSVRVAGESNDDADPWWDYHRCAGRTSAAIYGELARRIHSLPSGESGPRP